MNLDKPATYFLSNGLSTLDTSVMSHLARLVVVLGGLDSKHNLLTIEVDTDSTLLAETNVLRTRRDSRQGNAYE